MPSMNVDWIDTGVWNWVKEIVENANNLRGDCKKLKQ